MDPKSTKCRRYIFLNHGDDNELSQNHHCRFFGSIDLEGNIIRSEDIEVDDDEGLKLHLGWKFLFYNAVSDGECNFYQRAVGRLLAMDTQISNSPTVFIHHGRKNLKDCQIVTNWHIEQIKRDFLDSVLAKQLTEMQAVGIPMSRGDYRSANWAYAFINWYDEIVKRIAEGRDFMSPDILFRDLAQISEAAQKFYAALR